MALVQHLMVTVGIHKARSLARLNSTPAFVRFFQGPRFRHAFIYGDNDQDSLQINDTDVSLAFAVPNFLFSTQPLYILPSFSLHQWDGPNAPAAADLPSKAYSAFLDTGWQSDPLRLLGAELGVRVGVFSDFDTFTSDSLRVMGRGLGRVRITPTATLKGGVVYLDRNRVKLLPAGGVLWQPNPGTRFDLFFPEPKLAHYLSTVGTYDTWWYVSMVRMVVELGRLSVPTAPRIRLTSTTFACRSAWNGVATINFETDAASVSWKLVMSSIANCSTKTNLPTISISTTRS